MSRFNLNEKHSIDSLKYIYIGLNAHHKIVQQNSEIFKDIPLHRKHFRILNKSRKPIFISSHCERKVTKDQIN